MILYDLHKYILLFSLFYPEFFPILLVTNIFVIVIEKNVPRHLLASRAVASYIFARVHILGTLVPFYVTGNSLEFPVT